MCREHRTSQQNKWVLVNTIIEIQSKELSSVLLTHIFVFRETVCIVSEIAKNFEQSLKFCHYFSELFFYKDKYS